MSRSWQPLRSALSRRHRQLSASECSTSADAEALDVVTATRSAWCVATSGQLTDIVVECEEGVTALEPFGLVLVPAGFDSEQAPQWRNCWLALRWSRSTR